MLVINQVTLIRIISSLVVGWGRGSFSSLEVTRVVLMKVGLSIQLLNEGINLVGINFDRNGKFGRLIKSIQTWYQLSLLSIWNNLNLFVIVMSLPLVVFGSLCSQLCSSCPAEGNVACRYLKKTGALGQAPWRKENKIKISWF